MAKTHAKSYRNYGRKRRKDRKEKLKEKLFELNNNQCQICGRIILIDSKYTYAEHHLSYNKNIKSFICKGCHMWLHGQSAVYNHVFKKKYNKDLSPYVFAKAVVDLYQKNNCDIDKEVDRMRMELDIEDI